MLHVHFVTLFPEFFTSPLACGLMAKAEEKALLKWTFHNPRDYSEDRHHHVDDSPYGGGPGMVLQVEPWAACLREIETAGRMLLLTPSGKPFTQQMAREYATCEHITILCGRYEGFDERIQQCFPLEPVSVTDAVLNSGESAALCVFEAIARLQKGFMGKDASGEEESFSEGLLEYPQYTRPEVFEHREVPSVLLSGNHKAIAGFRREKSLERTLFYRRDLLRDAPLTEADAETLAAIPRERCGRNLSFCLVHSPVRIEGKTGTSSLTNLDIHDIARISASYGLGNFYVVTPLEDQRRLLETIKEHWIKGSAAVSHPDRAYALSKVCACETIDQAIDRMTYATGMRPFVVASSASWPKKGKTPILVPRMVRERLLHEPVLLLLGTAQGLAREAIDRCSGLLRPLRFLSYNHLSVRSAAAILADRILGDFD